MESAQDINISVNVLKYCVVLKKYEVDVNYEKKKFHNICNC